MERQTSRSTAAGYSPARLRESSLREKSRFAKETHSHEKGEDRSPEWLREVGKMDSRTAWRIRVERALRFVSMIPLALYLSYSNPIGYNYPYLIVIMYTIFAALMPPSPVSLLVMTFMGFPAGVAGGAAATLIVYILILIRPLWSFQDPVKPAHSSMIPWVAIALYVGLTIPVAVFRTGPMVMLLMIPLYSYVYTLHQFLCNLVITVKDGVYVDVPSETVTRLVGADLKNIVTYLVSLGRRVSPENPLIVTQGVMKYVADKLEDVNEGLQRRGCFLFDPLLTPPLAHNATLVEGECLLKLDGLLTKIDQCLKPLEHTQIFFRAEEDNRLRAHMHLPKGFVRFLWSGTGEYSLALGILICSFVVLGLIIVSTMLPPPRFVRSFFRADVFRFFEIFKLHSIQLTRISAQEGSSRDGDVEVLGLLEHHITPFPETPATRGFLCRRRKSKGRSSTLR